MSASIHARKLALGTVQFGLPYGVANTKGQVSKNAVRAILELAKSHGINTLDTAIAYGESEQVLGCMPLNDFEIVTKIPAVPEDCKDIYKWISQEIEKSLLRMNVSNIHGLLLHHPEQLSGPFAQDLYDALIAKKREGIIKNIGISIYNPEELNLLADFRMDIVQAPFNILDNRLKDTGWLEKIHNSGIKLYARSVFMQGLLLMSKESRPKKFNKWMPIWNDWESWLAEINITPLQACLHHAISTPEITKIIVGIDSLSQLIEIISALDGHFPEIPEKLHCSDLNLLNPVLWNNL